VGAGLLVNDIMNWKLRKHTYSVRELIKRFPDIREQNLECGLTVAERI
jgi:glycerol-3-phosphate dehydrogenase